MNKGDELEKLMLNPFYIGCLILVALIGAFSGIAFAKWQLDLKPWDVLAALGALVVALALIGRKTIEEVKKEDK